MHINWSDWSTPWTSTWMPGFMLVYEFTFKFAKWFYRETKWPRRDRPDDFPIDPDDFVY